MTRQDYIELLHILEVHQDMTQEDISIRTKLTSKILKQLSEVLNEDTSNNGQHNGDIL